MIISTREAFLGTRQQKDWAKPVPKWRLAKDTSKRVWEDFIVELKGLKTADSYCDFKRTLRLEHDGSVWGSDSTTAGAGIDWTFYYNEDYDVVFVLAPANKYLKDEDVKQKVMNSALEYLESGGVFVKFRTNVDKL